MKKTLLLLLLFPLSVSLNSCLEDSTDFSQSGIGKVSNVEKQALVTESKDFFANEMMALYSRSTTETQSEFLNPGDFTPLWDNSEVNRNDGYKSVVVPIVSSKKLIGARNDDGSTVTEDDCFEVTQKLTVEKLDNGKMQMHMITIIPDADYYKANKEKSAEAFKTRDDAGKYSGLVFYSLPVSNTPYMIEKYKNGKVVDRVVIFASSEERLKEVLDKVKSMTEGLYISGQNSLSSRSDSEAFWDNALDLIANVIGALAAPGADLGAEVANSFGSASGEMLDHFIDGKGEDYTMKDKTFDKVSEYAEEKVGDKYKDGTPFEINGETYYQYQVDFYGDVDLGGAFGKGTVNFDSNGKAVGYEDTYDFDSKPWEPGGEDQRSLVGELSTRIGTNINGTEYKVSYGVTK